MLLLLRPYRRTALVSLALGAAAILLGAALPLIVRTVIDQALVRRQPGVLVTQAALLLGVAVLRWGCETFRRTTSGSVGIAAETDLRDRLAAHLLALEPD